MKTAFTFISILIGSIISLAQKGSWYIGANAGFSSVQSEKISPSSENAGKSTSWAFSPEFGTFLNNNIQLGLGLALSGNKIDNQITVNQAISESNSYGCILYARYFWGKEAFKPFAGMKLTLLTGKSSTQNIGMDPIKGKQDIKGIGLDAGFSYALSKRVTAMGSFGFISYASAAVYYSSTNEKYKTTSFGFEANSLGDRFNIGFYFTLKKVKS